MVFIVRKLYLLIILSILWLPFTASCLPVIMQNLANQQLLKGSFFNLDTRLFVGLNAVHKLSEQNLTLIHIIGGMVIVEDFGEQNSLSENVKILVDKLQSLSDLGALADTSLLFYTGEVMNAEIRSQHIKYYGEIITQVPILTWAVDRSILFLENYMLFPSPQIFAKVRGTVENIGDHWQDAVQAVEVSNILHPAWTSKKDGILWQGRIFDYYNSKIFATMQNDVYKQIIQIRLVSDEKQKALLQIDKSDAIAHEGEARSYLEQGRYKYILSTSIEGGVDSELLPKLLSNSLLFRVRGKGEEWFYPLLQDGEHYIGIQSDLSDLKIQYNALQQDQDRAQLIAKNSTDFVQQYFNSTVIDEYLIYFTQQYSQLVNVIY